MMSSVRLLKMLQVWPIAKELRTRPSNQFALRASIRLQQDNVLMIENMASRKVRLTHNTQTVGRFESDAVPFGVAIFLQIGEMRSQIEEGKPRYSSSPTNLCMSNVVGRLMTCGYAHAWK